MASLTTKSSKVDDSSLSGSIPQRDSVVQRSGESRLLLETPDAGVRRSDGFQ